ncbi:putative UDP-N-acetylmuramoyl-L-alanyl-D-glutamate--2,6-diaminopimelate ligase [Vibrio nigripulchritudo SO65]|uniref:Mur ligase family protein n=1 Tax=Vibrio nigripulchritudo TaxID=28173 RepID=UPI0003B1E1FF|nr:UDP-N-acetylmuramyl-tripeptide synthetase [Vibrio nigripulchritudo]CCN37800.1 putative UDP-N-acetylmuramoyl-L-alanyl-D-glutamate--2,6-diaminopimelate ligase [Vibrio nigripulchritudo AM115]CCN44776.1 putative UDP-N-acetylmuramoyl-L-alanyl-D-glutamate--2,6-diaminopimelate ligase [Vibrio nigripulchritudo FTn2]CCN62904.1 putative UDP-N-acetylmuramoyl-L-alanyl-D-glutamate--2,6-diaminopimelate ligase [Vibrio nigripulchritudo POn4]CCN77880.1 putative UDP-N-acetylmuramoyl-L-alanyl-D-glutamate--2,6-d
MKWAAVTGTNGKTTSVELARQLLSKLGIHAASWGTLGVGLDGEFEEVPWYCNSSQRVHEFIQDLTEQNQVDVCLMECFSRLIEIGQYQHFEFDCAAFTNLTHDHLDYHPTLEDYLNAKLKLLKHCKAGADVWINQQDPMHPNWVAASQSAGLNARLFADSTSIPGWFGRLEGNTLSLNLNGYVWQGGCPFFGEHNVQNLLTSLGIVQSLYGKEALTQACQYIPTLSLPPGRLESIATNGNRQVFVDFAHNPDGLFKSLDSLNQTFGKKLVVVFGCGGDRDRSKRAPMAESVRQFADQAFITSDNSRSEPPEQIFAPLKKALPNARVIKNRTDAIYQALKTQQPDEIVVVAGRGHEGIKVDSATELIAPLERTQNVRDADIIHHCLAQLPHW